MFGCLSYFTLATTCTGQIAPKRLQCLMHQALICFGGAG